MKYWFGGLLIEDDDDDRVNRWILKLAMFG